MRIYAVVMILMSMNVNMRIYEYAYICIYMCEYAYLCSSHDINVTTFLKMSGLIILMKSL